MNYNEFIEKIIGKDNINVKSGSDNFYIHQIKNFTAISEELINKNELKVKTIYNHKNKINYGLLLFYGEELKYISFGYSIPSADGEFRNFTVKAQEYFEKIKNSGDLHLAEEYYGKYKDWIDTPLDYVNTIYIILLNFIMLALSTNNVYKVDMMLVSNSGNKFYDPYISVKKHFESYFKKINILRGSYGGLFGVTINNGNKIHLGTKIIPLTLNDMRGITSINKSFQREIYINYQTRKLIVNMVCPFFSCFINWSVFKNSSILFNNHIIREKLEKSAKYLTDLKKLYKMGKIKINEDLEEHFKKKLLVPINFMERNMLYSKYGLIIYFERYDLTVNYLFNLYALDKKNISELNINLHKNLQHMESLLIQVFYAFLCLNTKVRAIHGDLHLNNIMLLKYNFLHEYCIKISDNEYFNFQTCFNIGIIDFGRSIINFEKIADEFPADINEVIIQNQKLKMLFYKLLPKLMEENEKKIDFLFKTKYNLMFQLLSGLDALNFISFILEYQDMYDPEIKNLLIKIHEFIVCFIKENLQGLIAEKIHKVENIHKLLLQKFFIISKVPIDKPFIFCDYTLKDDYDLEDGKFSTNDYNKDNFLKIEKEYIDIIKDEKLIF